MVGNISITRGNLLFLQRTVGNRTVAQFLQREVRVHRDSQAQSRPGLERKGLYHGPGHRVRLRRICAGDERRQKIAGA